jgi:hypothetical protein
MSGGEGKQGQLVSGIPLFHHVLWARCPFEGDRVDATAEREEHVLVSPQHTFRHARRAAGEQDVEVIGGTRLEVPLRAALGQRLLVVD